MCIRDRLQYVETQLQTQIKAKPGDAKIHSAFGIFYRKTKQFTKAAEQFALARGLSPLKPSLIINQGFVAYEQGDYETAHSFFTEAYQLVPEYHRARIFYLATLILTERQNETTALLTEPSNKELLNNPFINRILTATTPVQFNEPTDAPGYDYIDTVGKLSLIHI